MTDQQQKQREAVEAMNKKVGYDVPLCYATLNTIVINTERKMGEIPLIEKRTAMAVIAEVIANTHGGMRLTAGHAFFDNCRVYEQDRGVFEEYSLFQEDYGQYLLWPYFAFRVKFEIDCNSGCVVAN